VGSASADRNAPSNTVLGQKYRLVRPIGRGAFGSVYEAEHAELGRRYAVKLLQGAADSERSRQRFAREARLLARLEHENIVSLIDAGEDPELGQYLVLEYIRGSTLRAAMGTFRGAPPERLVEIVRQLARGLAHAHGAGIVHRDLKPENVMLASHADGRPLVKILDFGIARMFDDEANITTSGAALGTAAYMAPEQARGDRDVDHRVDIYALGVIVYELLSGTRPFDGSSYNETLFQILTKPHTPLESVRPDLPRLSCAAIERALAKDRVLRFEAVEDFARAFVDSLRLPAPAETLADFETQDASRDVRAPTFPPPAPMPSLPATSATGPSTPPERRIATPMVIAAAIVPSVLLGLVLGTALQSSRDPAPAAQSTPLPSSSAASAPVEPPKVAEAIETETAEPASVSQPLPSASANRAPSINSARAQPRRESGTVAPRPPPRRDRGF
jgi:eukaryotic-like serine/threonine-protein kinase